jgi:hypothetical protein
MCASATCSVCLGETGYLAVALFLHEDHELAILLVQSILRVRHAAVT